ncbi:MAG TPA: ATP-binding protein [Burkholderiales bacterium]|nr:ATP-binding protein [Burkholderiales bacterium]
MLASGPAADLVSELSIDPDSSQVRPASEWLEREGHALGIPPEQIARLDICLNEVFANVLDHGGSSARSAPIGLRLARKGELDGADATLTVTDAGTAFDPLAVPPRSRPQTLAETRLGGLGLVMVRANADSLSYEYADGRNQLTIGVRWSKAQS